jgi:hypothetical protein
MALYNVVEAVQHVFASPLFLLAQAKAPVGVPLWAFLIAALGAPLATTVLTLFCTNRRERERQFHEERTKREEAWRVERTRAYTAFLALARAAKATEEQPISKDSKEALLKNLREAHARVAMVSETDDLRNDAQAYYDICKYTSQEKDVSGLEKSYKTARNDFFRRARAELGLPWSGEEDSATQERFD